MPIQSCRQDNKPGFKFGESGKCYTYEPNNQSQRTFARQMAERQERAIRANGFTE